jgi:hypothetical protein
MRIRTLSCGVAVVLIACERAVVDEMDPLRG